MIVNELSKELGVKNKELIDFLKESGFSVSSHLQGVTEEMEDVARKKFEAAAEKEEAVSADPDEDKEDADGSAGGKAAVAAKEASVKVFSPDDRIPCRSVTPWELNAVGVDRVTVYHWKYFGDVDYVAYRDLQSWRRKDIVTKPSIIIEDADICSQWKRELGEVYKPFTGVEYPEDLFSLPDEKFQKMLEDRSKTGNTLREIIKVTAMNMINNENYPDMSKIKLIDNVLGTCIQEFL